MSNDGYIDAAYVDGSSYIEYDVQSERIVRVAHAAASGAATAAAAPAAAAVPNSPTDAATARPFPHRTLRIETWNSRHKALLDEIERVDLHESSGGGDHTHSALFERFRVPSRARRDVVRVYADFCERATVLAREIVALVKWGARAGTADAETLFNAKRALGGVAGGAKFVADGILFKLCDDATHGIYGGDEFSQKAAKLELRGVNAIVESQTALRAPFTVVIDHIGHRVIAQELLPIKGRATLVHGSDDGGRMMANVKDAKFARIGADLARRLNLAKHVAGLDVARAQPVLFGADCEVHRGLDGVYYCIDVARLFPCEAPTAYVRAVVVPARADSALRVTELSIVEDPRRLPPLIPSSKLARRIEAFFGIAQQRDHRQVHFSETSTSAAYRARQPRPPPRRRDNAGDYDDSDNAYDDDDDDDDGEVNDRSTTRQYELVCFSALCDSLIYFKRRVQRREKSSESGARGSDADERDTEDGELLNVRASHLCGQRVTGDALFIRCDRAPHLTSQLRPELVVQWPKALSSDAFSAFGRGAGRDVADAHNELVYEATVLSQSSILEQFVHRIVNLSSFTPSSLTEAMHSQGLRVSHLPNLRRFLFSFPSTPRVVFLRSLALVEMLVHLLKNFVRFMLRRVPKADLLHTHCVAIFNLLFGCSRISKMFWESDLKALFLARYGLCGSEHEVSINLKHNISMVSLFYKLQEQVGIRFTDYDAEELAVRFAQSELPFSTQSKVEHTASRNSSSHVRVGTRVARVASFRNPQWLKLINIALCLPNADIDNVARIFGDTSEVDNESGARERSFDEDADGDGISHSGSVRKASQRTNSSKNARSMAGSATTTLSTNSTSAERLSSSIHQAQPIQRTAPWRKAARLSQILRAKRALVDDAAEATSTSTPTTTTTTTTTSHDPRRATNETPKMVVGEAEHEPELVFQHNAMFIELSRLTQKLRHATPAAVSTASEASSVVDVSPLVPAVAAHTAFSFASSGNDPDLTKNLNEDTVHAKSKGAARSLANATASPRPPHDEAAHATRSSRHALSLLIPQPVLCTDEEVRECAYFCSVNRANTGDNGSDAATEAERDWLAARAIRLVARLAALDKRAYALVRLVADVSPPAPRLIDWSLADDESVCSRGSSSHAKSTATRVDAQRDDWAPLWRVIGKEDECEGVEEKVEHECDAAHRMFNENADERESQSAIVRGFLRRLRTDRLFAASLLQNGTRVSIKFATAVMRRAWLSVRFCTLNIVHSVRISHKRAREKSSDAAARCDAAFFVRGDGRHVTRRIVGDALEHAASVAAAAHAYFARPALGSDCASGDRVAEEDTGGGSDLMAARRTNAVFTLTFTFATAIQRYAHALTHAWMLSAGQFSADAARASWRHDDDLVESHAYCCELVRVAKNAWQCMADELRSVYGADVAGAGSHALLPVIWLKLVQIIELERKMLRISGVASNVELDEDLMTAASQYANLSRNVAVRLGLPLLHVLFDNDSFSSSDDGHWCGDTELLHLQTLLHAKSSSGGEDVAVHGDDTSSLSSLLHDVLLAFDETGVSDIVLPKRACHRLIDCISHFRRASVSADEKNARAADLSHHETAVSERSDFCASQVSSVSNDRVKTLDGSVRLDVFNGYDAMLPDTSTATSDLSSLTCARSTESSAANDAAYDLEAYSIAFQSARSVSARSYTATAYDVGGVDAAAVAAAAATESALRARSEAIALRSAQRKRAVESFDMMNGILELMRCESVAAGDTGNALSATTASTSATAGIDDDSAVSVLKGKQSGTKQHQQLLYAFGKNLYGSCGIGDSYARCINLPHRVLSLPCTPKRVFAGKDSSFVVGDGGELFAFGELRGAWRGGDAASDARYDAHNGGSGNASRARRKNTPSSTRSSTYYYMMNKLSTLDRVAHQRAARQGSFMQVSPLEMRSSNVAYTIQFDLFEAEAHSARNDPASTDGDAPLSSLWGQTASVTEHVLITVDEHGNASCACEKPSSFFNALHAFEPAFAWSLRHFSSPYGKNLRDDTWKAAGGASSPKTMLRNRMLATRAGGENATAGSNRSNSSRSSRTVGENTPFFGSAAPSEEDGASSQSPLGDNAVQTTEGVVGSGDLLRTEVRQLHSCAAIDIHGQLFVSPLFCKLFAPLPLQLLFERDAETKAHSPTTTTPAGGGSDGGSSSGAGSSSSSSSGAGFLHHTPVRFAQFSFSLRNTSAILLSEQGTVCWASSFLNGGAWKALNADEFTKTVNESSDGGGASSSSSSSSSSSFSSSKPSDASKECATVRISQVCASERRFLALDATSGTIYQWFWQKPRALKINGAVKRCGVSSDSGVALLRSGHLVTWGRDNFISGSLGRGDLTSYDARRDRDIKLDIETDSVSNSAATAESDDGAERDALAAAEDLNVDKSSELNYSGLYKNNASNQAGTTVITSKASQMSLIEESFRYDHEPRRILGLDDCFITDFAIGDAHTLVIATPKFSDNQASSSLPTNSSSLDSVEDNSNASKHAQMNVERTLPPLPPLRKWRFVSGQRERVANSSLSSATSSHSSLGVNLSSNSSNSLPEEQETKEAHHAKADNDDANKQSMTAKTETAAAAVKQSETHCLWRVELTERRGTRFASSWHPCNLSDVLIDDKSKIIASHAQLPTVLHYTIRDERVEALRKARRAAKRALASGGGGGGGGGGGAHASEYVLDPPVQISSTGSTLFTLSALGYVRGCGTMILPHDQSVSNNTMEYLNPESDARLKQEKRIMRKAQKANARGTDKSSLVEFLETLEDVQLANSSQPRFPLDESGERAAALSKAHSATSRGGGAPSMPLSSLLSLHGERIEQIACGNSHVAFLSTDARLFMSGLNACGECGVGDAHNVAFPRSCLGLDRVSIASVACGDSHTLCVDSGGRLYAFGMGANGRLGLGDGERRLRPTLVSWFAAKRMRVLRAAAGSMHSVCVCESKYASDALPPTPVSSSSSAGVARAKAAHSSAIRDGEVYGWGSAHSGALSSAVQYDAFLPRRILYEDTRDQMQTLGERRDDNDDDDYEEEEEEEEEERAATDADTAGLSMFAMAAVTRVACGKHSTVIVRPGAELVDGKRGTSVRLRVRTRVHVFGAVHWRGHMPASAKLSNASLCVYSRGQNSNVGGGHGGVTPSRGRSGDVYAGEGGASAPWPLLRSTHERALQVQCTESVILLHYGAARRAICVLVEPTPRAHAALAEGTKHAHDVKGGDDFVSARFRVLCDVHDVSAAGLRATAEKVFLYGSGEN